MCVVSAMRFPWPVVWPENEEIRRGLAQFLKFGRESASSISPKLLASCAGWDFRYGACDPLHLWRIMQAETAETESTFPQKGKRTVTVPVFVWICTWGRREAAEKLRAAVGCWDLRAPGGTGFPGAGF